MLRVQLCSRQLWTCQDAFLYRNRRFFFTAFYSTPDTGHGSISTRLPFLLKEKIYIFNCIELHSVPVVIESCGLCKTDWKQRRSFSSLRPNRSHTLCSTPVLYVRLPRGLYPFFFNNLLEPRESELDQQDYPVSVSTHYSLQQYTRRKTSNSPSVLS